MPFVCFLLLAVLALLFISGGYTFGAACIRRKEMPWLAEEELKKTLEKYMGCKRLIL